MRVPRTTSGRDRQGTLCSPFATFVLLRSGRFVPIGGGARRLARVVAGAAVVQVQVQLAHQVARELRLLVVQGSASSVLRNVPEIGAHSLGDVDEESGRAERLVAGSGRERSTRRRRRDGDRRKDGGAARTINDRVAPLVLVDLGARLSRRTVVRVEGVVVVVVVVSPRNEDPRRTSRSRSKMLASTERPLSRRERRRGEHQRRRDQARHSQYEFHHLLVYQNVVSSTCLKPLV